MPVFAISPGIYSQEQDLSTGVQATATTIAGAAFASPKGSLVPTFISSAAAFLTEFGKPNAAYGYGHHSCLAFLMEGANLWAARVISGATYGTVSFVGSFEGAANTVQYTNVNAAGSLTNYLTGQQDLDNLVFSAAVATGMAITSTFTVVGADLAGNIVNQNGTATTSFNTTNDATLAAHATALNTAIQAVLTGSSYTGVLPVVSIPAYAPTGNVRQIQLVSAQGVSINVSTVVTGTSPPTVAFQNTKLFDVFGVNPGIWNNTIALKLSGIDTGTPQRGQVAFAGPILTGNTVTVTVTNNVTGVTNTNSGTPLAYATSSNATLAALAALLAAAPYSLGTNVIPVLGSTNGNRILQLIAPDAYTDLTVSVVVNIGSGASAVTTTYTKTLNAITPNNTFILSVYTTDDLVNAKEAFTVSMATQQDGFGSAQNVVDVINLGPRRSKYIRIYQPTNSLVTKFSNPTTTFILLSGGTEGATVTSSDLITSWSQFDSREKVELRMLINCGYTLTGLQQYLDNIAQTRKDCIAILDMPSAAQDPQSAVAYRNNTININSSYSAIYSPDLLIQDSYTSRQIYIPPSGYIAAVYAKTDRVAATWFAPAGLNRADLSSKILGLRYNYNLGDRNLLYPAQVNWIQKMPGRGYPVGSAETLQNRRSALSNVNVRRLLIFMEVSIVDTLVYYQWEPDDDFTRKQVVSVVTKFAKPIKDGRGLKDFLVVSDTTNNSPNDEDEGVLNIQFLVKPIIPAKFIRLVTTITSSGANFQEFIAQVS